MLIEHRIDEIQMSAFDAGWNAVMESLNHLITEKYQEGDQIAFEVLSWARKKIAEIQEAGKND